MKKNVILMGMLCLSIIVGCDNGGDEGDNDGESSAVAPSSTATSTTASRSTSPSTVTLNAFSDFSCTSGWTNRDGALGLRAGSGSGTCTAEFPGVSGSYSIQIKVQAERDGSPAYSLSINGNTVQSGNYPYACGSLMCNTPYEQCRDSNKMISVGRFQVNNGDTIEFYGQETYPCGSSHGAYAKWHQIILSP
ncbi:hypothetical protein [Desulfogranum marinum]|uniref:hypothetical protein n=1 Tax=Desulfogranum marinum TaxID=453220 RepID=UPI0019665AB2|nr:hypothetical protein [Desulfogranum marinum]MBM9512996.1 hypothetical protein [Desulfogranum marinum]